MMSRRKGLVLLAVVVGVVTVAGLSIARLSSPLPALPTPTAPVPAPTAAAEPVPTTAPGPVIPATKGKWTQSHYIPAADGSGSITFHLLANGAIFSRLGWKRPGLIVRCNYKSNEVALVTGVAAAVQGDDPDRHPVTLRFDGAPAETQSWRQSFDDGTLVSPDAVQTARHISRSRRLRVEFTRVNASPAIADFDVTGLDRHIAAMPEACGWSP